MGPQYTGVSLCSAALGQRALGLRGSWHESIYKSPPEIEPVSDFVSPLGPVYDHKLLFTSFKSLLSIPIPGSGGIIHTGSYCYICPLGS